MGTVKYLCAAGLVSGFVTVKASKRNFLLPEMYLTVFAYLYFKDQSIDTFDNLSGGVVYWLPILVENKGNMLPVDILLICQVFCQGWRGYLSSSDRAVEEHLTNEGIQRGGVTKCHSVFGLCYFLGCQVWQISSLWDVRSCFLLLEWVSQTFLTSNPQEPHRKGYNLLHPWYSLILLS